MKLEFWSSREWWCTSSLPLLPGPFWFRVVVSVRVPSRDQIDLFQNYLLGLVRFYGITTIIGYLMLIPVFTYTLNIWFVDIQLNDQTVLFQNNSVKHNSTKLNGSKYCYVSLTIQLNVSHLFAHSLNDQTVLFLTIQFSISTKLNASKYCYVSLTIQSNVSHLFAHSLNVKQFYLNHR